MISKISKGLDIIREKGLTEFLLELKYYSEDRIRDIYWTIKKTQTLNITGNTANFYISDYSLAKKNIWRMESEYEEISELINEIQPDDVFYDIGANIGLYSVFASQVCSSTFSFEPYPPNYKQLQKNLSYNPGESEIYQLALSDSNGEIQFSAPEDTVGYGTGKIGEGSKTVKTVRGDLLISKEGLESPDIVKIDVEGAEALVIDGMSSAISDCRRIYCEIHIGDTEHTKIEHDQSSIGILTTLSEMGFEISVLNCRENEIQVVGKNRHTT